MNRSLLKDNAKIALKQNFWLVMLVVLISQFLGVADIGVVSGGSFSGVSSYTRDEEDDWDDEASIENSGLQQMSFGNGGMQQMSTEEGIAAVFAALSVGMLLVSTVVIMAIAFAIVTFLTCPLKVGYRRFFMLHRLNKGKFSDLFFSFCSKYMKIVKGMITTYLRIFGWSLLFWIPGIIKSYQYFFVPFILCENPEISGERAREISTQMTDGHKWDIFVLWLSFFGWGLLAFVLSIPAALLTCCLFGVGAYLVYTPLAGYMGATYAELYEERREYALFNHIVTPQELCGFDDQTNL